MELLYSSIGSTQLTQVFVVGTEELQLGIVASTDLESLHGALVVLLCLEQNMVN
jgi:hypothetical protein